MQELPDQQLRLCVFSLDAGHHPATGFLVDYVGHAAVKGFSCSRLGERQATLMVFNGFAHHKLHDARNHDASHFLDYRNNDAVTELLVGLRVADRNLESVGEAHQAGAFAWCQAAWPLAYTL